MFGNPPKFPVEGEEEEDKAEAADGEATAAALKAPTSAPTNTVLPDKV